MSKPQLKQEQEALEKLPELNLSLEAQVYLTFKHKRSNRHKLLDQVTRANVILDKQLTDKTKFLHPKACVIAEKTLNKLFRTGVTEVVLTHKQLSTMTKCLADQNSRIIKQLGNLFEFEYKRKYLKYTYCYIFQLHPKIKESLVKSGGVL